MEFQGKKVIVTGANRSIGQRIAIAFAEQGADLVISYRSDPQGAKETVEAIHQLGRRAIALPADFSQMEQVKSFADQALNFLQGVDILINNAAMLCRETILELDPQKMQTVFQVNSIAPLYLTQLCAQSMRDQAVKGCIINISSISANMTMPRGVGYGASKAAVNKWTRHAALDLAKFGIRVNAVAPGVIASGMNADTAVTNPKTWEYYLSVIPLQCAGQPKDIENMVLFLASDKAGWVTGKIIEVDGGHNI